MFVGHIVPRTIRQLPDHPLMSSLTLVYTSTL